MIIDFLLDDIRKAIAGLEDEVSGLTAESFAAVDYVSSAKTIYFYNAVDEEVGSIDTTDFVVDGMIDTVSISGNVLHFVFNTDAGKQPIDVDLSSVMPDLSEYWTSAETQSAITAVEDHLFDVEEVTASALTELHDDILELSARTVDLSAYTPTANFATINGSAITNGGNIVIEGGGNSPIIPAITTQAEYEAISGDVKTGDLIQVYNVDINGDNNPEYGLFGAYIEEEESEGVIRKLLTWGRKDNDDSVLWSNNDYPWMDAEGVRPIDLGMNAFIISPDFAAEDEAYNGIGFDEDGKPAITRIAAQYDEETGEITGMTREDTPIGGDMSAYWTSAETKTYVDSGITIVQNQIDTMDDVVSAALVDLNDTKVGSADVKHIVKLTQAEYDALTDKDPYTFYIIISNS